MDLRLAADPASVLPSVGSAAAAPVSGGGVALLLDWENIKGCVRQEGDAAPKLKALLTTARQYGPLAVARAYADWGEQSRKGVDAAVLVRHAIEPIYTIGGGLRNSADIRLAVDAIALCERSPEITTYIIGSGDGGLVSVVNYLRLRGRKVIVIAVGASLSSYLREAADVTLCYEEAIAPALAQATKASDKPSPPAPPPQALALPLPQTPTSARSSVPTPDWEELGGWIIAILAEHGPGPYPFTTLAHQLKERHRFTVTFYAMKFRQCMERIAETHPILITSVPLSNGASPTLSYFVELLGATKPKRMQPTVATTSAVPCTPSVKVTKNKATPAVKPKTASPVAKSTPITKPKPAPTEDAAVLKQAFSALPRAVVEARLKSKHGIALYPAVQLILQAEIGCTLNELGRKPGTFFAEAARRCLIQTAVVTKGTSMKEILLLPGEPIPSVA